LGERLRNNVGFDLHLDEKSFLRRRFASLNHYRSAISDASMPLYRYGYNESAISLTQPLNLFTAVLIGSADHDLLQGAYETT
jgi:hypothetical protein